MENNNNKEYKTHLFRYIVKNPYGNEILDTFFGTYSDCVDFITINKPLRFNVRNTPNKYVNVDLSHIHQLDDNEFKNINHIKDDIDQKDINFIESLHKFNMSFDEYVKNTFSKITDNCYLLDVDIDNFFNHKIYGIATIYYCDTKLIATKNIGIKNKKLYMDIKNERVYINK